MCKLSNILWSAILIVVMVPWVAATLLLWIYTELFEADANEPKVGWIMAILHTVSAPVYFAYIAIAILFIGLVGRRSMFSFCCVAAGLPVFAVVPLITGGAVLFTSLSPSDEQEEERGAGGGATGERIGIAAGVACLLSTATCLFVVCWAMICGSRGRGKEHQYPSPLAYFPFLRDFRVVKKEQEVADSERYTSDYPPPLYTFHGRKPVSDLPRISSPRAAKEVHKATSNTQ